MSLLPMTSIPENLSGVTISGRPGEGSRAASATARALGLLADMWNPLILVMPWRGQIFLTRERSRGWACRW